MSVKKYIATRGIYMGYIRVSVAEGTVIEYDKEAGNIKIKGTEYKDLRDFEISMKVKDKKGNSLLLPYNEKDPEIKKIVNAVKEKNEARIAAKKQLVVEASEIDQGGELPLGTINATAIKTSKLNVDPKKLEVVKEESVPISSVDKAQAKLSSAEKPIKLAVVSEDQVSTGKTLRERSKATVKEPSKIISLRKK